MTVDQLYIRSRDCQDVFFVRVLACYPRPESREPLDVRIGRFFRCELYGYDWMLL